MFSKYDTHRAMHPLAEYISQKSLDGAYFDEEDTCADGFIARVGRRIFRADNYGFLSVAAYKDATAAANAMMWSVGSYHGEWADDEEVDFGF